VTEPFLSVPAREVANRFGYYTDEAMLHPVGIQRHGTTRVVMISLKEYERLLRRDRQAILTKDLDDETLDAILNAEPGERSKEAGRRLADQALGRETVLTRLKAHEAELKAMGIKRLSLFGSMARNEAEPGSDVDLAAELDRDRTIDLFQYGEMAGRLEQLLGRKVDLLIEPVRKARMQAEIDRDRVHVF
jgi:predicted nucleotidyltransferase/PHD/YefM family antitoxin component YafN of YafNO toxin-antitoxin module